MIEIQPFICEKPVLLIYHFSILRWEFNSVYERFERFESMREFNFRWISWSLWKDVVGVICFLQGVSYCKIVYCMYMLLIYKWFSLNSHQWVTLTRALLVLLASCEFDSNKHIFSVSVSDGFNHFHPHPLSLAYLQCLYYFHT
jgi:hypothetical protein